MSETYRIISEPSGEPRPAGNVGVRVRMQLSGCPSRRWSRDLSSGLVRELVGHRAVGHLKVDANELVQGDHIVLEGVEADEAPALAGAVRRAVEGANRASADEAPTAPNMTEPEAQSIAREVWINQPDDAHA